MNGKGWIKSFFPKIRYRSGHRSKQITLFTSIFLIMISMGIISATGYSPMLPKQSASVLPDTLQSDLKLKYKTYIQYTTDNGILEHHLVSTTQNFTTFTNGSLLINESIDANSANTNYDAIRNKKYTYVITNSSNTPTAKSTGFPGILNGSWMHNYPYSGQFVTNSRDSSYLVGENFAKVINLTYSTNVVLKYKAINISTKKFTGSLTFMYGCNT
jgi:hypothetical protein